MLNTRGSAGAFIVSKYDSQTQCDFEEPISPGEILDFHDLKIENNDLDTAIAGSAVERDRRFSCQIGV